METGKNKYSKLRGFAPVIAKECDCSDDYVRKVLSGLRKSKTDRATLAIKIYKVADRIIEAIAPQSN